MQQIRVIDSHTAGEPTRCVIAGGPELGSGTFCERFDRLRQDNASFRSAVVNEPRGSDVLVGALLCEPDDSSCVTGVMFFNNTGFLGMCGHGTIGLIKTLQHLGRIDAGRHRVETPVGVVTAVLTGDGDISVQNVPSFRHLQNVSVETDSLGTVVGDVAYGGNWFFLTHVEVGPIRLSRAKELTALAMEVRCALDSQKITGADGATIDHVEFSCEPAVAQHHSRNFVLCPGGAFDRSPCGTGTSAKLACLAGDGKLRVDDVWFQESIIGSVFRGSFAWGDVPGRIVPTISGKAFVTGEATLILDPDDPFRLGFDA